MRAYQIRDPITGQPHRARKDQPLADASDWAVAEGSAAFLCELDRSGRELDEEKLVKIGAKVVSAQAPAW